MARVVLITGSNMGGRREYIRRAEKMLEAGIGRILAKSSVTESEPWGDVKGADAGTDAAEEVGGRPGTFLNQVLVLETGYSPPEVLDRIQGIEKELGRVRTDGPVRTGDGGRTYLSRTMDIDIIFYDDIIMNSERLTIPHPLMARRRFVLEPLAETVPGYTHPVLGKKVAELLEEYNENDK